ncbi:hypothetical protein [Burkholderia vietnamiensis]|uniref:hypothetical protein n=1 Tax=Burkholderia vietnamiensis TaxID=60552 RepID=UPI001B9B3702|nr:hypothetical protein [Burkholderia vietnamiensis]MBR8206772.1 hypothetical protein [Burkholderia vietnamiensis]MCA8395743.1 hypothetical protein [Burkholderia vietnamiensis]HDR8962193.1 hypothetical protein [Burkholderia vietnamiensis]HDR9248218.1 hypothetical protein [Burkholderia vietnamiensis]
MKKLALILAFASVATGVEAADQVRLMLDANLQDPNPQMVSLHDVAKCRYVGELQPSGGDKGGVSKQLFHQAIGAPTSWSITITRKTCEDGVSSPVSLVVPLRNLNTEPGYAAGSVVMAHPAK